MVGLILAFMFLTPRSWFRDQPRIPGAQQIVMLPSEAGVSLFWIDQELVEGISPEQLNVRLSALLKKRTGKPLHLSKVEPVNDSEGLLKGFLITAR